MEFEKLEQIAFGSFKKSFTIACVFAYFNFNLETWVECNSSDYMIAVVLSQKQQDRILRPLAFMFKKMSLIKYNYEIYNKKLFIIISDFNE